MQDLVLLDEELGDPAELLGPELLLELAGGHILVEQQYLASVDGRAHGDPPLLRPERLALLREAHLDARHNVSSDGDGFVSLCSALLQQPAAAAGGARTCALRALVVVIDCSGTFCATMHTPARQSCSAFFFAPRDGAALCYRSSRVAVVA